MVSVLVTVASPQRWLSLNTSSGFVVWVAELSTRVHTLDRTGRSFIRQVAGGNGFIHDAQSVAVGHTSKSHSGDRSAVDTEHASRRAEFSIVGGIESEVATHNSQFGSRNPWQLDLRDGPAVVLPCGVVLGAGQIRDLRREAFDSHPQAHTDRARGEVAVRFNGNCLTGVSCFAAGRQLCHQQGVMGTVRECPCR